MGDLFPPKRVPYMTDGRLEVLRQQALDAEGGLVPVSALTLMELVSDWRNMAAELAEIDRQDV